MTDQELLVDWEKMKTLRVSKNIASALQNMGIMEISLIREGLRKTPIKGVTQDKNGGVFDVPFILGDRHPYCREIQKDEEGLGRCQACFRDIAQQAMAHQTSYFKVCHAGLLEIAIPVIIQGKEQGVLRIGEVKGEEGGEPGFERLKEQVKDLKVDVSRLKELYQQLLVVSPDKRNMLIKLLELMVAEMEVFVLEGQKEKELEKVLERHNFYGIISKNAAIREIVRKAEKIAASDSTVLIYGESGTGKELIANLIHKLSPRANQAIVTINCAAITETLLEAELFGYEKGSFTNAIASKQGLFEIADGGTVFLDEIGDMSLQMQVKILRIIQEGSFIKIGGTTTKTVNVRVIAATNKDLKNMVQLGYFREDLYYRLAVLELVMPPLRERREDIPLIAYSFLKDFQTRMNKEGIKFSPEAMNRLMVYSWPGNVRELKNEIERVIALKDSHDMVKVDDFSSRISDEHSVLDEIKEGKGLKDIVDEYEKSIIAETLRKYGWNKSRVAEVFKITRQGLIKKIEKYQLDKRKRKATA